MCKGSGKPSGTFVCIHDHTLNLDQGLLCISLPQTLLLPATHLPTLSTQGLYVRIRCPPGQVR